MKYQDTLMGVFSIQAALAEKSRAQFWLLSSRWSWQTAHLGLHPAAGCSHPWMALQPGSSRFRAALSPASQQEPPFATTIIPVSSCLRECTARAAWNAGHSQEWGVCCRKSDRLALGCGKLGPLLCEGRYLLTEGLVRM